MTDQDQEGRDQEGRDQEGIGRSRTYVYNSTPTRCDNGHLVALGASCGWCTGRLT
jgi:hypothetical protein